MTISPLTIINQLSPQVIKNPVNPVKQVATYTLPNTFITGDSASWSLNGTSMTGSYIGSDSATLSSLADLANTTVPAISTTTGS